MILCALEHYQYHTSTSIFLISGEVGGIEKKDLKKTRLYLWYTVVKLGHFLGYIMTEILKLHQIL